MDQVFKIALKLLCSHRKFRITTYLITIAIGFIVYIWTFCFLSRIWHGKSAMTGILIVKQDALVRLLQLLLEHLWLFLDYFELLKLLIVLKHRCAKRSDLCSLLLLYITCWKSVGFYSIIILCNFTILAFLYQEIGCRVHLSLFKSIDNTMLSLLQLKLLELFLLENWGSLWSWRTTFNPIIR